MLAENPPTLLGPITQKHAEGVVTLVQQGLSDCTLVSSLCGGRVSTHRLLLAIHSPLLAGLLRNVGEGVVGLTLPLPITTLRGLVALLQGEAREVEKEVKEAAAELCIEMDVKDPQKNLNSKEDEKLHTSKIERMNIAQEVSTKSSQTEFETHNSLSTKAFTQTKKEDKPAPSQMVFVKEEDYDFQNNDVTYDEWSTQGGDYTYRPQDARRKTGGKSNGPRKVIPGSEGITYASAVAKAYLDYMLQHEVWIDKVTRTEVCKQVRSIYRDAWGHQSDGACSKLVKTAINRAIDDYKLKVGGIRNNGSQTLSEEEETVKEILKLDRIFQSQGIIKDRKKSSLQFDQEYHHQGIMNKRKRPNPYQEVLAAAGSLWGGFVERGDLEDEDDDTIAITGEAVYGEEYEDGESNTPGQEEGKV